MKRVRLPKVKRPSVRQLVKPTVLQVLGVLATGAGVGMVSVPGGICFVGVATLAFGIAAELPDPKRG